MRRTTQRIDVGDHELRLVLAGEGPPDLLCLHGLVDRIEIWDRVAGPLAERGRLALLDQRGHGESGAPAGAYTREDLAADVSAVIHALGSRPTVLVGHSMGGIVSMTTALAYPEQIAGLVLIGTASQCNERTAGWYERIARAGEEHGMAGLRRAIYGEDSDKEIHGEARAIAQVTRTLKSLYESPLTPKLRQIECPVLLIVGDKDPMGPRASSILASQLPRAELVTVPDCGHWVHVSRPGVVIDAIDRFLPRIQAGAV